MVEANSDLGESYYEKCLIACKGSVERAKAQLDKFCTLRTLLPHFFGDYNVKRDFGYIYDNIYLFMLPKITDDHYRVEIVKFRNHPVESSLYTDLFKSIIIIAEYIKAHDYVNGFIVVVDFTESNLLDYTTKLNLVEFKQILTISIEAYGMRIRGIHIITTSKFIDTFLTILKQVLSSKIAGRIHIHKSIEEIYKIIPKSILPKDYGGEERSIKELQEEWIEALSSDEHMECIREMNEAGTDETCRQRDKFNEQYAGMSGTFRLLSVD